MRPGTASGGRRGMSTATPLNPFGLDGGGRASDADARDPLTDSLAKAQSLLGRYAEGGDGARPGTAGRPGSARPGSARPRSTRPKTAGRPGSARVGDRHTTANPRSEVMTLDHGPTQTDSWPNDDEIDYDDSYGDGSFEAQTSGYLDRSDSGAADVLQLSNENSLTGEISFSVDVDEIVDDASVSLGGDENNFGENFEVEEDSLLDEIEISHDLDGTVDAFVSMPSPPASPSIPSPPRSPTSWGDVASLSRPGTVSGQRPGSAYGTRPQSAKGGARNNSGNIMASDLSSPRSDPSFVNSTLSGIIRSGGLSAVEVPLGAVEASSAPWSGAFDGDDPVKESISSDDDSDVEEEIVYDEQLDDDEYEISHDLGDDASPLPSPTIASMASLKERLGVSPMVSQKVSPPSSPKRSSPRSSKELAPLRVSKQNSFGSPSSPAAMEAEDATEQLHRSLSGNDPVLELRKEVRRLKSESPDGSFKTLPKASSPTLPPPESPRGALPPVSPRGVSSSGRPDLLSHLTKQRSELTRNNPAPDDDGYSSSSADEIATEGDLTPISSFKGVKNDDWNVVSDTFVGYNLQSPRGEQSPRNTSRPSFSKTSPVPDVQRSPKALRTVGSTNTATSKDVPPRPATTIIRESIPPAYAHLDSEDLHMLNAIKAARRGEVLDPSAAALLSGLRVNDQSAREAAVNTKKAFEYVAAAPLAKHTEKQSVPQFSTTKAEAEARALAREDVYGNKIDPQSKDQWFDYLNGNGSFPGAGAGCGLGDGPMRLGGSRAKHSDAYSALLRETSPELEWAVAMRARSFEGAMRARVAALRVQLRTAMART